MEQLVKHDFKNIGAALKNLLKTLSKLKDYKWAAIDPINRNRYYLVYGSPIEDHENILVVFKREFFNKFGEMFKHLGKKGVGSSINVKDLKTAIQNKVETIYCLYPDGSIYYIPLMEFLEKSNNTRWTTKAGTLVRSISISEYKSLRENTNDTNS